MITIVEPKEHIEKLWGKQQILEGEVYRLMRYVLRVEYGKHVLLHNVVTGHLVILDPYEEKSLDYLPARYSNDMRQLVESHFLVPDQFDEHQQVVKMRHIMMMLDDAQRDNSFTTYTIIPTTACNARCYYCFEQGAEIVTMSKETADDAVKFITANCGTEKKAFILWFGGEPTVASHRIDQICKGLYENGVSFESDMISNGYLFDEDMVDRAKMIWNLKHVQLSVDGTEELYNKIKNYVDPGDDPYRRVMRNVGLLLKCGIRVGLRMNFDLNNHDEFKKLLKDVDGQYEDKSLLNVYAYPIIGEYADNEGKTLHGSKAWFDREYVQLNDLSRKMGLNHSKRDLPFLKHVGCGAFCKSAVTITAKGTLVRCSEKFEDAQMTGDVRQGVTRKDIVQSWRELADVQMCNECVFFPECIKLKHCSASENCYFGERNHLYELAVKRHYADWMNQQNEKGGL